jgi:hypothetical protein
MVLRRRGRRWVLVVLGSSSSVRSDGSVVDVVEGTALIPCGLNDAFTSASVTCLYRPNGPYLVQSNYRDIVLKEGSKGRSEYALYPGIFFLAYSVTMMIQKIC